MFVNSYRSPLKISVFTECMPGSPTIILAIIHNIFCVDFSFIANCFDYFFMLVNVHIHS